MYSILIPLPAVQRVLFPCFVAFLLVGGIGTVQAQMSSVVSPDAERPNNFSVSASYGEILNKRNAWFYGFAADYTRRLAEAPFGVGSTLMWDSETDRNARKTVGTYTFAITGSWIFSQQASLGTGIAKGFMDNDNPDTRYRFNNGDWATGLILTYAIPARVNRFVAFSGSLGARPHPWAGGC